MKTIEIRNEQSRIRRILWYLVPAVAVLCIASVLLFRSRETGIVQKRSATTTTTTNSASLADSVRMVTLTPQSITMAGVRLATVDERDVGSEITAVGIITIPEPGERTIAARARGRIERMYVNASGSFVRQGEPLYEFYSPDILNAEHEYVIAANADATDHKAMTSGMQHHANTSLAQAGRERLRYYGLTDEQITALTMRATIPNTITVTSQASGLVLQKLQQEGAYVDEGSTIFQIADLSTVWAEVEVPESAIRFIHNGEYIQVSTEAYPNERFAGRIILIFPVEDQASRTVRVRVSLANPKLRLRPNMTFTTTIPIAHGRSISVPADAVVRTGKGDFVWVHESGDRFIAQQVTLGSLSTDNYYQIVSGLVVGQEVAAQGAFLIDAEYQFTKTNPMAAMNMGETGNKSSGEGLGTVRAIDVKKQTITLDHGNIAGVMPAMTMAYRVSDPAFLRSVAVNESVRFTLARATGGEFEIASIRKQ